MSSNPNNIMSSNPIKNVWQVRAEKLKQIKSEPIIKIQDKIPNKIPDKIQDKIQDKINPTKKEWTPESKIIQVEKTEAFTKAQNIAIKKCLDICNKKIQDDINDTFDYEINPKRTLILNVSEDDIIIEVNTNKYTYSFKRFLGNYHFQNKLREEYNNILPCVWIKLFPGYTEDTYCISIQKKR